MDEILFRRSIRKFDLNKKISYDDLLNLCRYGEAAPSAKNQKSREYIIVDDKSIIDELSTVAKGTMILSECNTVIVPVGKNPNTIERPEMQVEDLSAATENILIAATKMGFGSCWCGIYPINERVSAVNKILNIENDNFAFSIIALGYPKNMDDFKDKNKFSMDLVKHNRG